MALLDARKALHMFDKLDLHVIGMVENMSSFICDSCGKEHYLYGTGGVHAACSELGVGFLGQIPLELGIRKGSDFGKPFMANEEKNKNSKIWDAHIQIADRIDKYVNPPEKSKGLISKLLGKES
jgi:ATP-binding protein involved in chromosome partitioning